MRLKRTTLLWSALESVPGLSAVSSEWRERLGGEYEASRRFLLPTTELASAYPCPRCGGTCQVVEHGPDDLVAVCEDGCQTIKVTRADLVVWRVNIQGLQKELAAALGLTADPTEMPGLQTYRIGAHTLASGRQFPVYLTLQLDADGFRREATDLCLASQGQLAILAPTRTHLQSTVESPAAKGKAAFVVLSEVLGLGADGKLGPILKPDSIFQGLRELATGGLEIEENVFRRFGDVWEIAYAGQRFPMKDLKGLAYIAHLLAIPRKVFHVAELVESVSGEKIPMGSSGEVYDGEAIRSLNAEMVDLREDLAVARNDGDEGRQIDIETRLADLEHRLRAALGRGGKLRKTTDCERHRKAVSKAMREALTTLKPRHPELWRHLMNSLKMGFTFCYAPEECVGWAV